MLIGYARVSTRDQHLNLQQDALRAAGCEKIFLDEVSGTVASRPGLDKLKEQLRSGDILVVWRLDRLGRSIRDLIDWVTKLEHQGVGFQSLQESIDTTTSNGKLVFQTLTDGEMKTRMEISHDGHVSFAGYISEQLEIVHVTTDVGWGNPDQPLPQYFRKKLKDKPKGTILRVLTDLDK